MSNSHYFVLVYGGRVMGGNPSKEHLERLAEFFGEGTEIHRVEGAMPTDLSEVAARFYSAQEAQVRDEVEALLEMTAEEREELLEAVENPEVRAILEHGWGDDPDTTEVTSRSGFFRAVHLAGGN